MIKNIAKLNQLKTRAQRYNIGVLIQHVNGTGTICAKFGTTLTVRTDEELTIAEKYLQLVYLNTYRREYLYLSAEPKAHEYT